MKSVRLLVAAIFALSVPSFASAADVDWQLDTAHTSVTFSVKHLAVSTVRGKFTEISESKIKADANTGKISSLTAKVKVASIDTGIEKRDNHLKSGDFFDAAGHPLMTFKTKSIKFDGDEVTADIDLTIRGTTKTVKFKGEWSKARKLDFGRGPQLNGGYSVSAKIKRLDFGLTWNSIVEGLPVVSDEVKIQIDAEIFRKL